MEHCGYVKANKLTEEYIIRQDMNNNKEAISISKNDYKNKQFDTNNKKIYLKNTIFINEQGIGINNNFSNIKGEYKYWTEIFSNLSENQMNIVLRDYKTRTNFINTIIEKALEDNINGIVINFDKKYEKEDVLRFVIEIAPKLREFGVSTGIVLNENIEKNDYIGIVDYIIE